jgi:cell division protein FtsL
MLKRIKNIGAGEKAFLLMIAALYLFVVCYFILIDRKQRDIDKNFEEWNKCIDEVEKLNEKIEEREREQKPEKELADAGLTQ